MPRDDDYAQVDGEQPFATSMHAQPWMAGGVSPWHMWGNTITLRSTDPGTFANTPATTNQLIKVAYGRPDTWQWMFSTRLLEAPNASPGDGFLVVVEFDVVLGAGRSIIRIPAFERYTWRWGHPVNPVLAPLGVVKWSTQALGVVRADPDSTTSNVDPWLATGGRSLSNVISEVPAQDIQVQASLRASGIGTIDVLAEISGIWAPRSHVRPDWFRIEVPETSQFSGSEIEGR